MLYKRDILQKIEKVLFRDEFLILSGARQTGKTSILLILKNLLEEKGFLCHYFNLENQQNLKFFNADPLNLLEAIPKEKSKQFIFIDEIQYLDNPSNFLKLLHDEYKNRVKIIASGSSSFYIDKKFRDSLVGRKFLFEIYPLNFDEFLVFKKEEKLFLEKGKQLTLYYRKKLEKLWNEYLTFGGYPKVVLAEDEELKKYCSKKSDTHMSKRTLLMPAFAIVKNIFHS